MPPCHTGRSLPDLAGVVAHDVPAPRLDPPTRTRERPDRTWWPLQPDGRNGGRGSVGGGAAARWRVGAVGGRPSRSPGSRSRISPPPCVAAVQRVEPGSAGDRRRPAPAALGRRPAAPGCRRARATSTPSWLAIDQRRRWRSPSTPPTDPGRGCSSRVSAPGGRWVARRPGRAEGDAIEHAVAEHLPVVARSRCGTPPPSSSATVTSWSPPPGPPARRGAGRLGRPASRSSRWPWWPMACSSTGWARAHLARRLRFLPGRALPAAPAPRSRGRPRAAAGRCRAGRRYGAARCWPNATTWPARSIRLSAHIAALEATISWKVTTPLRRVNTYARGMAIETVRRIRG